MRKTTIVRFSAIAAILASWTLAYSVVVFAFAESNTGPEEIYGPPPSPSPTIAPTPPPAMATPAASPAPASTEPEVFPTELLKDSEIEPMTARLRVRRDTWILTRPTEMSAHLKRAHAGKFVNVTGTTHYYLRVQLQGGDSGYILQSAVELVKPADKLFTLTTDAPVFDSPNRWGKKVAGVHHGHVVHVVGSTPGYFQIEMKSGLRGFVTQNALE